MGEQEILDGFVKRYGERILSAPTGRGFNLLAYLVPPVALVGALVALVAGMRRSAARTPASGAMPTADPAARARLAAALRTFDAS
jgi:cytochrome c-type biogenesis protein CcmH/NrfF